MRNEEIAELGIEALRAAKRVHDALGEDGLTPVPSPNQFGEQVLKADVEAEKAVLETLTVHKMPIRVISEEHGTTDITANPQYLGVLDGIDGTSQYRKGRGVLRYGTMFGVAKSLNPQYEDYLFSGIMEHSTNRLWLARPGLDSYVIDIHSGKKIRIKAGSLSNFEKPIIIYSDEYHKQSRELYGKVLKDQHTIPQSSCAVSYIDVASGAADFVCEITRKGNLEQMAAYGLLNEAGADMYSFDGISIGAQRYLEFGQTESMPIFTAANPSLAEDFLRKFNSKK